MKATLRELLNVVQQIDVRSTGVDLDKDVEQLTWGELTSISLLILKSKEDGTVPKCILAAKAIQILTSKAIEKDLTIF